MIRILVDWKLSPLDKFAIRRSQEISTEDLTRAGVGRVEGDPLDCSDDELPNPLPCGGIGRARRECMVIRNKGSSMKTAAFTASTLSFVAGSSIFPTGASDLPKMTIAARAASRRSSEKPSGYLTDFHLWYSPGKSFNLSTQIC